MCMINVHGAESLRSRQSLGHLNSHILQNTKIHYRVHRSPPLVSFWSQMNPLHTRNRLYLRFVLMLSSHLRLCLPVVSFPMAEE
jgi:hypothetical protein